MIWSIKLRQLTLSLMICLFTFSAKAEPGLSVDVTLRPAGSFKAETTDVKGEAIRTKDGVAARDIIINLRSLTTGISLRDKHLKERLLVDKHPEAKLIKALGKDGKGKAILEVKGTKQTVLGTYTVEGDELHAKFKMHLPKLGITGVKYMGVGVLDDVMVNVTVPIKDRKPPVQAEAKAK